jgi:hypothetical protein
LLQPGIVLGRFEVLAPLGAGGMGEVYRARDTRLRREVAIKVPPAELAADVGREGETSYRALELVDGQTLRRLLAPGPPPLRRTLHVAAQLAEGLAAADGRLMSVAIRAAPSLSLAAPEGLRARRSALEQLRSRPGRPHPGDRARGGCHQAAYDRAPRLEPGMTISGARAR